MKKEQMFYFLSWFEKNSQPRMHKAEYETFKPLKKKIKELKANPDVQYIRVESHYHWYRAGEK